MTFAEVLAHKSLWAALLMGMFLPVIGRHLILGRTILLGLAVPQISMTGIAAIFLGHALGWAWCDWFDDDSSRAAVGALVFTVPALLTLALMGKRHSHFSEAWLAFLYLAAVAAANLMLSSNAVGETYLSDLFHGRLILISDASMRLLACALGVGFAVATALRRRFLLVLTDPDFAAVTQVPVLRWKAALALLDACVIGVSVATAGPLVTFGLLILPGLAAASFARSLRSHFVMATFLGVAMAAAGFWASYRYDLPLGDSIVAAGCVVVLFSKLRIGPGTASNQAFGADE